MILESLSHLWSFAGGVAATLLVEFTAITYYLTFRRRVLGVEECGDGE